MFCVVACFLVRMFWWRSNAVSVVEMRGGDAVVVEVIKLWWGW